MVDAPLRVTHSLCLTASTVGPNTATDAHSLSLPPLRRRWRGGTKADQLGPYRLPTHHLHTPRLLRSARNERLHPAIIPRFGGGFIFSTVITVDREEGRSAKLHPSGRLTPAQRSCPHPWTLRFLCVS